jgi:hypothetical protein
MTISEKLMVARLLEMASEQFSNHGCNDLDNHFFAGIPEEEIDDLDLKMFKINGDPECFEKGERIMVAHDSGLMDYFSGVLLKEVEYDDK